MKQKKCLEFLDFGIFPGFCMFSNGYSYDEIMEELKQYKGKQDRWAIAFEGDREMVEKNNFMAMSRDVWKDKEPVQHYFFIVTRDLFKFTDYEMIKLAHECLHICQFYLPGILDRNKEIEAEAYLHSHLMNQCLKILRKNKVKE